MKKRKLLVLVSITGIYFFSMFHRIAVPGTIFDELQVTFEASAVAIATLGSIYLYIYGGMQIFTGMLADKLGSSKVLIGGGIFLAGGSIFFPFSNTIGQLYITRALVGLGASLIYLSMLKHISTYFSTENFPFLLSCSIAAGYSGGLAATYPFERATIHIGWQNSILITGFFCLFLVALSAYLLKDNFSSGKTVKSFAVLKNILKNKFIYPVIISGSGNFSIYFVLQATIGKKMLEDFAGLSSAHAASFTFAMMATAMVSVLVHGYFGKKSRKRKLFSIIAALLTLSGVIMIIINMLFFNNAVIFLIAYLLCAYGGGNILNPTLIKELNPEENAGTAVGIYNGAMYSSVAIVGNLAGMIMDLYSESATITPEAIIYPANAYTTIFAGCLLIAIISLLGAMKIREPALGRE